MSIATPAAPDAAKTAEKTDIPEKQPVQGEQLPTETAVTEKHPPETQNRETREEEKTEETVPQETGEAPDLKEQKQRDRNQAILERRNAAIRAEVEEAKNPDVYEHYGAEQWESDPHLRMFSARRAGRRHIRENIPCQDYCLTREGKGYVLMAGSDGVSACKRSDVGSRLACEAVAAVTDSAADSCETEEALVKRLCSLQFRTRVVRHWIKAAFAHYKANPADSPLDAMEQLYLYGATLMFVVITPNWYVAGNLGDGQILFFNEMDSMKIRVHPRKESSKVICLVNTKCAQESFQVMACPRNRFNGVLLTTDGIYGEAFGQGQLLYQYAKELRERFLRENEPLLPFCYQFEDGLMRDLYARKTDDDCTVVLALDDRPCSGLSGMLRGQLDSRCEQSILLRMGRETALYGMMRDETYFEAAIVPENRFVPELPELSTARIETTVGSWCSDGCHYGIYPETTMQTLEYLQCTGKLREQKENVLNASAYVLDIYRKLRQCQWELEQAGLTFTDDAHFLVGVDSETRELVLRREAVQPLHEEKPKQIMIWSYFESLLGMLSCGTARRPLFSTGYITRGPRLGRVDGLKDGPLCCVEADNDGYVLTNLSSDIWRGEGGREIRPGDSLPLKPGASFVISTDSSDIWVQYRYTAKENL